MRRYGWKPDVPDLRDFPYTSARRTRLPTRVDLRGWCSPVEDQGALGSCTGHAVVAALEWADRQKDGRHAERSRLFAYYEARRLDGDVSADSGASVRAAVKAAHKVGVCREALWPYKVTAYRKRPPGSAYVDAGRRKAGAYRRVVGLLGVRRALAARQPVVFGFGVYESFERPAVAATGAVPEPRRGERLLGGHAVLAVGYDDPLKRLICRNSYGRAWGMAGYFTLPYAFVVNGWAEDFWTLTD